MISWRISPTVVQLVQIGLALRTAWPGGAENGEDTDTEADTENETERGEGRVHGETG